MSNETPPLVYWADSIQVKEGEGLLSLTGEKRIPPSATERSLMNGYLDAIANANPKDGVESISPHIVFANCMPEALHDLESPVRIAEEARQSPEARAEAQKLRDALLKAWETKLREFVLIHGPVLAEPESVQVCGIVGDPKPNSRWVEVTAQQRWNVLRREQLTLSDVMRVFEQTRSKSPSHDELFRAARGAVSGTAHWVEACETEAAASRPGRERPSWIWTGDRKSVV